MGADHGSGTGPFGLGGAAAAGGLGGGGGVAGLGGVGGACASGGFSVFWLSFSSATSLKCQFISWQEPVYASGIHTKNWAFNHTPCAVSTATPHLSATVNFIGKEMRSVRGGQPPA